jgi:phosphoribosylamine--glycine ligase
VELASCQDYKRAHDGDRGPNTGGMGAYSPSVHLGEADRRSIVETIVQPTVAAMAAEGTPYRGVLYVGVMLTERGPYVLEYNARFGDPEAQVLVPRLAGDWLELLHACASGRLGPHPPRFADDAAVCVVMSARDYPAAGDRGSPIRGLERAEALAGVEVFHAGTARDPGGTWVTAGGRVLGVTACAGDLAAARARAYEAVGEISWNGARHRTDIALDAVRQAATRSQA